MLGDRKAVLKADSRRKNVKITQFTAYRNAENALSKDSKNALNAAESINCSCRGGRITTGLGLRVCTDQAGKTLWIPSEVTEVKRIYPVLLKTESGYKETLSFLASDGGVYVYDDNAGAFSAKAYLSEDAIAVTAINGDLQPKTVYMGKGGSIALDGAGARFIGPDGTTNAGCVCGNRLFMAVSPFSVAYSAPLEIENFTPSIDDGGEICLPTEAGEILSLVALDEYVYIVYERGISRLNTAGAARDFCVEKLAYSGEKILAGSVAACGGALVFLAEDGGYRAQGTRVEKAWKNSLILPLRGGQVCDHAVFEGAYLLRYIDKNGRRRTVKLEADGEDGAYTFDAPALSGGLGKAYCCLDGKIWQIVKDGELPTNGISCYVSERTDFGVSQRKLLRELRFKGSGNVRVNVDNGRTSKSFPLTFSDGEGEVKVFLRGETFTLTFILERGAEIVEAVAALEYLA